MIAWLLDRIEINVANGEITHYEHILCLPQTFHNLCAAEASSFILGHQPIHMIKLYHKWEPVFT